MLIGNLHLNLLRLACRSNRCIPHFKSLRTYYFDHWQKLDMMRKNKNRDVPKHVKKRKKQGYEQPAPFIELQVIGTGARGSPRSVQLILGPSR